MGKFSLIRTLLSFGSTVALSSVLIATVCLSFGQTPPVDPSRTTSRPAEPAFTVASYNINYGNADLKTVAATIRKADADLVCLQETNRVSQRYLSRSLSKEYRYSFFRGGYRAADGFGFLSKTPIRKPYRLPAKYKFFETWFCTVKLDGKDVRIVNVHLRPFSPRGLKTIGQALKRMAEAEMWRMKEIAYIRAAIAKQTPVIVAGDFNAPPTMASAKYLTETGFVDSFAAVNPNDANQATWRWKYKGIEWQYRLDYIFATKNIQPRTSRIIKSNASDHYLVVSGFSWPKNANPTTRPAEAE